LRIDRTEHALLDTIKNWNLSLETRIHQ
jgi:hypothetical protein